ncbi:antibiotic biosynthesis monooxygenase [Nocardioides mesophilus]|uniref:Antibiotic biosynthesis monooxygenase n=1 Tax=Nocardioides mesophilus TaxID=433659 RepID=A0A7G9RCA4_9ACTN|nr:antibiotic biosynthesis monooxygenase [Nocardioides mesophilus]QNN53229.1 antibiotic biosynthesis monooxygenase [Nocardioides mesophilus]
MWAQVQRVSTDPEREAEVLEIFEQLRAIEQEDSGLLQTLVMRSQKDPTEVFVVVVFESEEKARAREEDPRRQEPLQRIRAAMGDVLNGPPDFFDCDVLVNS